MRQLTGYKIMSKTIETDYEGFKQIASDFFKILKTTTDQERIDAGLKCLGLAYLGMTGNDLEKHQAVILYELANKKAMEVEFSLL